MKKDNKATVPTAKVATDPKSSQVSWGVVIRFWWWLTWRTLLTAVGGSFAVGFVLGLILAFAGVEMTTGVELMFNFIGGVIGFLVTLYFMRKVLSNRRIGNFVVSVKVDGSS